jgi:hypothetical protein
MSMDAKPEEKKTNQGDGDQRTWAQKAAEHDRQFGVLTESMVDYYDNEHRADKRSEG